MNPADEIIEAVKAGDEDRVKTLLAADPSLASARNARGETPVLAAVYRMQASLVRLFIAAGANLDIFEAVAVGSPERVESLVSGDPSLVNLFAADGFTPLGLASFFGHAGIVAFLLSKGADVNMAAKNDLGVAPLHSAAAGRHGEIVRLLLDHGSDVNARQQSGYTALHSAAHNGGTDMVRLLLERGAAVNAKSDDGVTPLQLALERTRDEIVGLLRMHGAGAES